MRPPPDDVPPLPGTWWVVPGRLLAGEYPGSAEPALAEARLATLLDVGIDYILDLTWPGELDPYDSLLPDPYRSDGSRPVTYARRPIRDHSIPEHREQMVEILDELDDALAGGHAVYVHCRAGIGRTGMVVGCHLARRLGSGAVALAELQELWRAAGRDRFWPRTPETDEQVEYVRLWGEVEPRPAGGREPAAPPPAEAATLPVAAVEFQDRFRGLLLGLAVGDALGMPLRDRRPGSFDPVADLVAGGPHGLPAGAWTDDTALALLLAESLAERRTFDAHDQVRRYQRWQREGYRSSTGRCVGISATTARALAQAQWTGNPLSGPHDPSRAEKEPLGRAAVAAAWALLDPEEGLRLGAEAARTTHQAPLALDACRYYAGLVLGALLGAPRETLLAPYYEPVPGCWSRRPLKPEVAAVAAGGWRRPPGQRPGGAGRAVEALALVLWALDAGRSYRDSVLAAVNLGHDADTNGALVGAVAGALYRASAIPPAWRAGIAQPELVAALADGLLEAALGRVAAR